MAEMVNQIHFTIKTASSIYRINQYFASPLILSREQLLALL